MPRERLINGTAAAVCLALSVVLWLDYLGHSSDIYGERDAAQARIKDIDAAIAQAQSADDLGQLSNDRIVAETDYANANRRINDMDGWKTPEWKVKNALRLAMPAATALFGAFLLLSILHPLHDD